MDFNEYMNKQDSTPFSFRILKKDRDEFQRLYPYCLSRFVKLCIKRAVEDKQFFDEIYFYMR